MKANNPTNHEHNGRLYSDSAIKTWWSAMRWKYNKGLVLAGVLAFVIYATVASILLAPYEPDFEITLFTIVFQGFCYFAAKEFPLGAVEFENQFNGINVDGGRILGVQDIEHSPMGYASYVNGLQNVITSYNSQFDSSRAYALAKLGIIALDPAESNINNQERDTSKAGYTGTKCP